MLTNGHLVVRLMSSEDISHVFHNDYFHLFLIFLTDKDQTITPKIHPSRLHLQVRVVDGQMHKEGLLSFS